jgi:hypothetical protein
MDDKDKAYFEFWRGVISALGWLTITLPFFACGAFVFFGKMYGLVLSYECVACFFAAIIIGVIVGNKKEKLEAEKYDSDDEGED